MQQTNHLKPRTFRFLKICHLLDVLIKQNKFLETLLGLCMYYKGINALRKKEEVIFFPCKITY